jgi:hypothetical protein
VTGAGSGPLRVGNASGFYGDRFTAVREMLEGGPLDVLTGDYLAELTMLILGRDRLKDSNLGYARTFLRQLEGSLGLALDRGVRIVANAGGLNPAGLAAALRELAGRLGLPARIAHVEGDDLLPRATELGLGGPGVLTANAYLGCWGIAQCLRAGADVVVTGRVTDAALVCAPAAAHFGWTAGDYDALAGAVVAGHVLECGAQATGGNYSFFTELPGLGAGTGNAGIGSGDTEHGNRGNASVGSGIGSGSSPRLGFPIAEIYPDGSSVITKHPGTSGAVTPETVTAQLLYEIDEPAYRGPDVTARFDTIELTAVGPDRVRIGGVHGEPPGEALKVCLNSLGGFRNAVTFVLTGLDIGAKADLVRRQLDDALGPSRPAELTWTLARTDRPDADTEETASALLHCTAKDADPKKAGRAFSAAAVELALASYPGFTMTAPPGDATPYGVYRAAFVPRSAVNEVAVLPDGTRVPVPPPPLPQPTLPSPSAVLSPTPAPTGGVAQPGQPGQAGPRVPASAAGNPGLDLPVSGAGSAGSDLAGLAADDSGSELPEPVAGPTRRAPLGAVLGARSGDKGGTANLGVWARTDTAYRWLVHRLTVDALRRLLPETAGLDVRRYLLPNLRAVNFVLPGLLGEGVASSVRFDPQAKGLGEWLRSRQLDIPVALLDGRAR